MADLPAWPDIEDVLIEALVDFGEVDSMFPADMQGRLCVRVQRLGGSAGRITDSPRVDVDVAAPTRAQAMEVARKIEQRLTSGPVRTSVGVIDRGVTEMGPHRAPSADEHVRHVVATYRLSTRRLSTVS